MLTYSSDCSLNEDYEEQQIDNVEATQNTLQAFKKIEEGQIYANKDELLKKLCSIIILGNFDYTTIKSTKQLLVLQCHVTRCTWRIRASTIGKPGQFKKRIFIGTHTCSVIERGGRHRQATPKSIGELYVAKFGNINVGIRPSHITQAMKTIYGIDIDCWKSYRALVHAREMERGTWESGYEDLSMYLHRINAANPGTISRHECDGEDRFKYLFIAYGAYITGFKFIRKVLVVDGTHLKGKFKGILLVAAGQDGNGMIFSLAFGIIDYENDASWEWFFDKLRSVCGDYENLVIISHRHKSIGKSIKMVFKSTKWGICMYHLFQNLIAKFKKSNTLFLVKKAIKVYKISEFIAIFNDIKTHDPRLMANLEKADVRLWSQAHFLGNRYDIMTSNIVESLNNALRSAREYPITCFLEELRKRIAEWFEKCRELARELKTLFIGLVEATLAERSLTGNTFTVRHIDRKRSQVSQCDPNCVVDLEKKTCTCRVFDIDKISCVHTLTVIGKRKNVSLETFVDEYYTKSFWYNAYAESINPIDVDTEPLAATANFICHPPKGRRGAGKLKKI